MSGKTFNVFALIPGMHAVVGCANKGKASAMCRKGHFCTQATELPAVQTRLANRNDEMMMRPQWLISWALPMPHAQVKNKLSVKPESAKPGGLHLKANSGQQVKSPCELLWLFRQHCLGCTLKETLSPTLQVKAQKNQVF